MGRKKKTTKFTSEQFVKAIEGTGGIVSAIAKRVGCSWHTAKKYIDSHPSAKLAFENERETVLDFVESKAIDLINEGDAGMIRYYLSTRGRGRGFAPVVHVVDWRKEFEKEGLDPSEEFERLVQSLAKKMSVNANTGSN